MGVEAVGGEEGGIARRLWIKFRDESVFTLYTPFVVCLASGVLDPQSFVHCISQDAYFLRAFAHAYELAEEYADDDDDKIAIRKLRKRVLKKLNKYDETVREWGFELPSESISDNATVKYTDFLLATASGTVEGEKFRVKIATPFEKTKLAAYTLAAIGPCLRLYAFISKEILALEDPDQSSHIYKKWVDSLSSQKFEEAALQIDDLLDRLTISLTGEELNIIEKLYHQSMKLEVKFFSDQPILQQTIVPFSQPRDPAESDLSIFCDFDMTCTAIDSSALLAEIAIRTAPKADMNECETQLPQMSSADLRTTWGVLSSQYTEEYEQCVESIMTIEKVEEFNYKGLCRALEQLSSFEKRANSRLIQSGVLKGLNLEEIKRAGEHLILQDGCKGFFQEIVKRENLNADIHVLSYCWCGDLIRSAFASRDLNVQNVHSNELAYNEFITTGEIIKKVESPIEKLQAFNDITKARSKIGEHFTVYIGGSMGDLLCLLKADVGIVIGSSSSLQRVGDQFGVSFVPLFSGLVKKQRDLIEGRSSNWKGPSGILYTVSSWAEIHAFIFGA
ncbi:heme oxygenase-like, multi-helical [Actinidia rufa]|uniref:Heme oxygenase-like, multi-helical n=1 Tax=Actinidia rufa TaxID=165716 RepID=A0A7J0H3H7_9ERIC|nr:heme oxygenase-like, multi-helical [Actinidia rufa]